MSYFRVLSGFVENRDRLRRQHHLGASSWDDTAMGSAIAWFTADFSQRQQAFDLEAGRSAMREILGMYFVGASFFRTTGLYERQLSGGLAAMVFDPMTPSDRVALATFKERVRACAKHLAVFFEQDSVAAVVQSPEGRISLNFVSATEDVDFTKFLKAKDLSRTLRLKRTIRRLPSPTVYGD